MYKDLGSKFGPANLEQQTSDIFGETIGYFTNNCLSFHHEALTHKHFGQISKH